MGLKKQHQKSWVVWKAEQPGIADPEGDWARILINHFCGWKESAVWFVKSPDCISLEPQQRSERRAPKEHKQAVHWCAAQWRSLYPGPCTTSQVLQGALLLTPPTYNRVLMISLWTVAAVWLRGSWEFSYFPPPPRSVVNEGHKSPVPLPQNRRIWCTSLSRDP